MDVKTYIFALLLLCLCSATAWKKPVKRVFCIGRITFGECIQLSKPCKHNRYEYKFCPRNTSCCNRM